VKTQEKHFKKALKLNPEMAYAHYHYACLLSEKGWEKYKLAEYHFKEALRINPERERFHNGYALFLLEKMGEERYAESEKHFKKALKLNPESSEIHSNYAGLLLQIGTERYPEAEKHVEKALEIDPENGPAWAHLGLLYIEEEDYEAYADCLLKALAYSDRKETIFEILPYLVTTLMARYVKQIEPYKETEEKYKACKRILVICKLLEREDEANFWYKNAKKHCKTPENESELDFIYKYH